MSHLQPRALALAIVTAAVVFGGIAPVAAQPPTLVPLATVGSLEGEYVPGELVVGFRPASSTAQMTAALDHANVTVAQELTVPRTKLVKLAPGESAASAMDTLRRQPGVEFVEPNYIYHADATPNDNGYGNLWAFDNTGQSVQGVTGTADADIDAPEAWNITTGSTSVVVAIVDTGIDYNHPDLAGNLWTNPGETGGGKENNGIDDDGDGFIDDWHGWDFVNNDNDPRDYDMQVGHGTHVAGTIGARGNNGGAVVGVNWQVSLVSLRVFDATGSATNAAVTNAFNYAGDRGIRVVNFSGGGPSNSSAMQAAIDNHPNTLYVVAAGNSGLNLDAPGNDEYPCEYPSSNLICVAASTQNDTLASFSNYGSTSVDIAAPGVNIVSLAPAMNVPFADTFATDPFASRWTKGSNAGSNTWTAEPAYSPLVGQAPSLTDGSSLGADYAANSDTYVQTTNAISLNGQFGCSAMFTMYLDVQSSGDRFRVWTRPDTGFDNTNFAQNWSGTGFVDDIVDLNALSGGPLYLRLGLFSDAIAPTGFDGVYIDNLAVRCVGNSYSTGGNLDVQALSGTSMAAPQVTGAAALVLSRNAGLSTSQLRNIILTTGDVKAAFQGGVTASGMRLNLFGAVTAGGPSDTTPPGITITNPPEGATYTVGQAVNANYGCSDTGGSGLATCSGPVANGSPIDTSTPGAKTFTVNATDTAGNPATSTHNYTVATAQQGGSPSTFVSLTPTRLLDTRGNGTPHAGDITNLVVTGRGGVPSDGVSAVLVNLTVTNTSADGYLTTWSKGETRPNASSLNFAGGQTVANLVVAKVGADGSISIWNSDDSPVMRSADIIVDIVGYFPAAASMGALSPARVLDTRSSGNLNAGGSLEVPVLGRGGVPSSGVGAVIVNLTVTDTNAGGYLTTWPTGQPRPNASSLNFAAGQTVANLVVAKVGADGSISIWNSNDSPTMSNVDVLVDVVGWLPSGAGFGSLTPARILDTRATGWLGAGATIDLAAVGKGGVPSTGVGAVIVNLTVTGTKADGYLTTWPTGQPRPNASSLNFAAGQTVANLVVAKVGADGSISIWNSNDSPTMSNVDVLVDVVGWFST